MRLNLFIFIFLFICIRANNDYINPIKGQFVLSGSFGELRNNHFHAGIDVKTGNRIGIPIFSIADGYVYRIINSNYNTGKSIYIYHPSTNKVSMYAHLQTFTPILNRFIKNYQYSHHTEEIDVFLAKEIYNVRKGQQIGLSGNTGASIAPHLHFELRDTNDNIFNPLLHGFTVQDNISPIFYRLYLFPKDYSSSVNNNNSVKYFRVSKDKKGIYRVKQPITVSGNVYFGISAFDFMNFSSNICSPSKIEVFIDSQMIFKSEFDYFNQKNTRNINSYMDYRISNKGNKIHTSYISQNNKLEIYYSGTKNSGVFNFNETRRYNLIYIIYDANGNKAILITELLGIKPINKQKQPVVNIDVTKTTVFEGQNIFVQFPFGSLFDNTYINIKESNSKNISQFNVKIHNEETPLNSAFYIKIKDFTNIKNKQKIYIVKKMGEIENPCYTEYKNGYFISSSMSFGTFGLAIDEQAPFISINKKKSFSRAKSFSLSVFDSGSGIKRVDAFIDNKWVLLNVSRWGKYTHYFDSDVIDYSKNEHKLLIKAEDYCGNISIEDLEFTRVLSD